MAVQSAVLRSAQHLLQAFSSPPEVELVTQGPAVAMCRATSPLHTAVGELLDRGVIVSACRRSLARERVATTDLTRGVTVVPTACTELTNRQFQGWAYISAGGR